LLTLTEYGSLFYFFIKFDPFLEFPIYTDNEI
jgi:hypothetical protein